MPTRRGGFGKEGWRFVVGQVRLRRACERVVQEARKVPVDEELLPQEGDEARQVPRQAAAQLQIADEQDGDQCCPNLDLQSVGARTDERFDAQILFQRFEEQFHLPALPVQGHDRGRGQFQMIGEENELALRFRIPVADQAEEPLVVRV